MPSINKSNDPLGTYYIQQHPEMFSPALSNHFTLFIKLQDRNGNPLRLLKEGSNSDYIDGNLAQEILMLSVDEAAVPHNQSGVIEVKRGNGTIKFAGATTYPSGQFQFNDYVGADTKSALLALRRMVFNKDDETVANAADYKVTAQLVEYTQDNRQIRVWDYFGFWCSQLSEDNFAMDNNSKRRISATFEYDRAVEKLPDDNESNIVVSYNAQ